MNVTRRTALMAGLLPFTALAADALTELERRAGGRLGVMLLDTRSGRRWTHRSEERFGLCSTFKLPLAGAVLQLLEQGELRADTRLPLHRDEGVQHMPTTEDWLVRGWAHPAALAEAAQTTSDSLAANVLLRALGGPEAFTRWLRSHGDAVTRIDRFEPEMNRVSRGEVRDTSSPAAFAETIANLCAGDALTAASRGRLISWMEATQTGRRRLRSGLPARWRAGDKTGTGFAPHLPDRINDVAIFWPPGSGPWVLACFYEGQGRAPSGYGPRTKRCLPRSAVWRRPSHSAPNRAPGGSPA